MKILGMLAGLSYESSLDYYRLINQMVNERLGGVHSAKMVIHSVDFAEYAAMLGANDWQGIARGLSTAAASLAQQGAEGILIATNTMHLAAGEISAAAGAPVIHIVQAVGREAVKRGYKTLGLLGTKFTMEKDLYFTMMEREFGIKVVTLGADDREELNRIIFQELVVGELKNESREKVVAMIRGLREQGAEAAVLGCTEIPMLVKAGDSDLPLLDTTAIHAGAAVEFMLG